MDEKDSYRRTEGTFGKFFRQFKLPTSAKAQEISAKVENGVLIVTVPKTEESRKKSKFEMWNSQVRDAIASMDHIAYSDSKYLKTPGNQESCTP